MVVWGFCPSALFCFGWLDLGFLFVCLLGGVCWFCSFVFPLLEEIRNCRVFTEDRNDIRCSHKH